MRRTWTGRLTLAVIVVAQLLLGPLGGRQPQPAGATGSAVSGTIPWHPHLAVAFASGVAAGVDLADGHVDLSAADLAIPGRHMAVSLGHTWDSTLALAGVVTSAGQGWETNLTRSMSGAPGSTVTYTDSSGAQWVFPYSGGAYVTPPGAPVTLTARGAGHLDRLRRWLHLDELPHRRSAQL